MRLRWVVAATCAALVGITVWRGVARASDWQLMRQDASGEWRQRGPVLDHEVACRTALASDGIVVPSGTRLKCERVLPTKEAKR